MNKLTYDAGEIAEIFGNQQEQSLWPAASRGFPDVTYRQTVVSRPDKVRRVAGGT